MFDLQSAVQSADLTVVCRSNMHIPVYHSSYQRVIHKTYGRQGRESPSGYGP